MEADSSPVRKWSRRDQLWIKLYPAHPVFSREIADPLHDVLRRHLPGWSAGLGVAKHADAKLTPVPDTQEGLSGVLAAGIGLRRGLGTAVLKGAYKGIRVYLDSCDSTVPPELNHVAIEIGQVMSIEGIRPDKWALPFFEELVRALSPRYGNARLGDEFARKNIVDDETGLRAVGVRLEVSLPGLYWLNYFGGPYVTLLAEERLLAAPAHVVRRVGEGIMIALDDSPLAWQSDAYRQREKATLEHLGSQFFFDASDLARSLLAPSFR